MARYEATQRRASGHKVGGSPQPGALGPAIFLSPHYDDVVLSCGGTVATLVDAGCEPPMVAVFGGETPEELVGDFARWKHSRWGYDSADAVLGVRRGEDTAAATVLGCRTRWLGYFDAIYRGDRYARDGELCGQLREVEEGLVPLLADEISALPEWVEGTTVYVPLAIGDHVDHQITFAAGRLLAARGIPVFAYEDCPYAIHSPHRVAPRRAALGDRGVHDASAGDLSFHRRYARRGHGACRSGRWRTRPGRTLLACQGEIAKRQRMSDRRDSARFCAG